MKIFTIGHSTHHWDHFVNLLTQHHIELLADVRHFPGSKRYPHFGKDHMAKTLPDNGIDYLHLIGLGGRRKPLKDSPNTAWRNEAFRGYADYMQTAAFNKTLTELKKIAQAKTVAIMCSEAVWWRCHRSLIADRLKFEGWQVLHIMALNKTSEHPYTSAATITESGLSYAGNDLFSDT